MAVEDGDETEIVTKDGVIYIGPWEWYHHSSKSEGTDIQREDRSWEWHKSIFWSNDKSKEENEIGLHKVNEVVRNWGWAVRQKTWDLYK